MVEGGKGLIVLGAVYGKAIEEAQEKALERATSKEVVVKVVNLVFLSRHEGPTTVTPTIAALLELDTEAEAEELFAAVLVCIRTVLVSGALEDLAELFNERGSDVHQKLKQLVGQTIALKLDSWKDAAASSRVSLPRYVDVDWSLNIKKASSEVVRMSIPSILVELEVEKTPTHVDMPPTTERIPFELSQGALETMLDGLGRIRDQLGAMG